MNFPEKNEHSFSSISQKIEHLAGPLGGGSINHLDGTYSFIYSTSSWTICCLLQQLLLEIARPLGRSVAAVLLGQHGRHKPVTRASTGTLERVKRANER